MSTLHPGVSMSGRALIVMDLRNAARNLASWRKQADSRFARHRIAYWRQQCDRLLDMLNGQR